MSSPCRPVEAAEAFVAKHGRSPLPGDCARLEPHVCTLVAVKATAPAAPATYTMEQVVRLTFDAWIDGYAQCHTHNLSPAEQREQFQEWLDETDARLGAVNRKQAVLQAVEAKRRELAELDAEVEELNRTIHA